MNREPNKYVVDQVGHVYTYVPEHHQELIGNQLQFCERPGKGKVKVQDLGTKAVVTPSGLKAIRAQAAELGLDIPEPTTVKEAQALLDAHIANAPKV
jgi:hypothetical protein